MPELVPGLGRLPFIKKENFSVELLLFLTDGFYRQRIASISKFFQRNIKRT